MSKLIVVIGATGAQGGSVARLFAKEPGWRVRGITRDPSKASSVALQDLGVEMVAGDLDDPASLRRAFAGANALFANTDFWQFLQDPATYAEAEKKGKYPNQVAYDREVQQGKNIVNAAAKHVNTLDRFVLSTLADVKGISKGSIEWVFHLDAKAAQAEYLKQTYPALAAKTTYLMVGFYMANLGMKEMLHLAPAKEADGSYVLRGPPGFDSNIIPFVHPPHDVGLFTKALLNAPAGTMMLGYARQMRYAEFWKMWARIKGVELEVEIVEGEFVRGVPEWLHWEFREMQVFTTKYGFDGGVADIKSPEELGVETALLTDLEEFMREGKMDQVLQHL